MASTEETEMLGQSESGDWIEMDRKLSLTDSKQSRFQVAKVDFAADTPKNKYACDSDAAERQPLAEQSQATGGSDYDISSYNTHNVRSLRHYTREALPRVDHYRNVMSIHGQLNRPTLDELHNPSLTISPDPKVRKILYFMW